MDKSKLIGWTITEITPSKNSYGTTFTLTKDDKIKTIDFLVGEHERIVLVNELDLSDGEQTFLDLDDMIADMIDYKWRYAKENGPKAMDSFTILPADKPAELLFSFIGPDKQWTIKTKAVHAGNSIYRRLFSTSNGRFILLDIVIKYGLDSSKYPDEWKKDYPELFL